MPSYPRKILHTPAPHKLYAELIGDTSDQACVFIPGGYHTGVCYLQTPDGRAGWAELAASYGITGITTDMPGTGRSGAVPFTSITSLFIVDAYEQLILSLPHEVTLFVHSLSGFIGFLLAERLPRKIKRIVAIEPSLIANVQDALEPDHEQETSVDVTYRNASFSLNMSAYGTPSPHTFARFTMKSYVDHLFPSDETSLQAYEASLQAQHPRLMYELFHVHGSKPALQHPNMLKDTRILIITTQDPLHIADDHKIVSFLQQHGISVEHWKDGAHGTERNGHMLMIEKNNHALFKEIVQWIKQ